MTRAERTMVWILGAVVLAPTATLAAIAAVWPLEGGERIALAGYAILMAGLGGRALWAMIRDR